MTTIELTDEEAAAFIEFRKHQLRMEQLPIEHPKWKHLKMVVAEMEFGNLTIVIKDKIPIRIRKPMQEIMLGDNQSK